MKRIPGRVTLILLMLPIALKADTLIMRSGEELHGSIENQDRERVIIRIDGDLRVVPKSTLKRIIYHQDDARAVELALLAEQEAERKAAEAEAQRKAAEEAEKRRLAEE
ncbi:MAG: hypothetical protein KDK27_11060, partial [Leptospiraceae bacterium]|nr:hypothetical protein [Leptospiraceae bacterium]